MDTSLEGFAFQVGVEVGDQGGLVAGELAPDLGIGAGVGQGECRAPWGQDLGKHAGYFGADEASATDLTKGLSPMAANRPEAVEATLAMRIAIPVLISTSTPAAEQAVDTTAIRISELPDDAGGTDVIEDRGDLNEDSS